MRSACSRSAIATTLAGLACPGRRQSPVIWEGQASPGSRLHLVISRHLLNPAEIKLFTNNQGVTSLTFMNFTIELVLLVVQSVLLVVHNSCGSEHSSVKNNKVRQDTAASSPAVQQALAILEEIARNPDGQTLTEISKRLGLPKNAVFRITRTLQKAGYMDRDQTSLRFRLTNKFLTLGQTRGRDKTLGECALPTMRWLRDQCRETVQLGVRSGDGGVIIEVLDGLFPLRITADVGMRFPLHNNAPGKCLLAYLPQSERDTVIARLDLTPCTPRTITDPAALREECDQIIVRGYCTDYAEASEGVHCIAAPVFNRHLQASATVWVSGPPRRLAPEAFAATGKLVAQAAAEISGELSK
jgi:IclR family transcriptional regulator, KDG regulon repressor